MYADIFWYKYSMQQLFQGTPVRFVPNGNLWLICDGYLGKMAKKNLRRNLAVPRNSSGTYISIWRRERSANPKASTFVCLVCARWHLRRPEACAGHIARTQAKGLGERRLQDRLSQGVRWKAWEYTHAHHCTSSEGICAEDGSGRRSNARADGSRRRRNMDTSWKVERRAARLLRVAQGQQRRLDDLVTRSHWLYWGIWHRRHSRHASYVSGWSSKLPDLPCRNLLRALWRWWVHLSLPTLQPRLPSN